MLLLRHLPLCCMELPRDVPMQRPALLQRLVSVGTAGHLGSMTSQTEFSRASSSLSLPPKRQTSKHDLHWPLTSGNLKQTLFTLVTTALAALLGGVAHAVPAAALNQGVTEGRPCLQEKEDWINAVGRAIVRHSKR